MPVFEGIIISILNYNDCTQTPTVCIIETLVVLTQPSPPTGALQNGLGALDLMQAI